MSKTKTKSGPQGNKGAKAGLLTKVKGSAVTKPAETVKAKSKEIAKEVAKKAGKEDKKKKKIVKVPTPEPESASEEEEESDASASDDSDSESDSEVEAPAPKVKANGVKPSKNDNASDESDSDSEESASEDETLPTKTNGINNEKAEPESDSDADSEDDSEDDDAGAAKASANVQDSEDDSESDSDESESDEEVPKVKTNAAKVPSKAKTASSDEEDSDEDDSDDSEESDADEETENQVAQNGAAKRKADEESPFAAKKAKVDAADPGKGPNLFIGNLSWNIDEEWLRSEFESFGEISGVRLMVDRATGRSKGYGYVEFVNAADAAKAHETKQGAELDGRAMNVDFANARTGGGEKQDNRRKSYGDQVGEPSDTLFVGNLSFNSTQDSLTEAFASHGTIQSIRLPTDRETGAPKGFGWITFASQEEASAALTAMQGAYVDSRPIRLDYGTPKPQGDSPARGGFGGRGRGGFNGGRGRGGFGDRGRGAPRGGRGRGGFSTNRGGFGDFSGRKTTF